jgi:hypothetical protein
MTYGTRGVEQDDFDTSYFDPHHERHPSLVLLAQQCEHEDPLGKVDDDAMVPPRISPLTL